MNTNAPLPPARDKLLFTPGPLTTSLSVKAAMLHDAGSWHFEFNAIVKQVRDQLLGVAGLPVGQGWEAILLQGSGTFAVEATFVSVVPRTGRVAVLSNGAYGERMVLMLQHAGIDHVQAAQAVHGAFRIDHGGPRVGAGGQRTADMRRAGFRLRG